MQNVLIIGPAHPLRGGGITTFNHRLAKQFTAEGFDCSIISFSLQYPSFLFPGKSQYSTEPPPEGVRIEPLINSINPFNWLRVGLALRRRKPDLVVVRFWLPLMGPALGTVLRLVRRNKHTRIVCIADNVVPHEKRPGDRPFTAYFLRACDAFITMSEKVMTDLRRFEPEKPALTVPHPLYDNFGDKIDKAAARRQLAIREEGKVLLFFGFIRHYKGLDLLLQAMADSRLQDVSLLVAGEFYEDEAPYKALIAQLGIGQRVILHTHFIADKDVSRYFCAADAVVQPYRNATQSGVTPLAYHFEKPMIVTNVGGLPALVPHEKAGLVTEPAAQGLTDAVLRFYELGEDWFRPFLLEETKKLSWERLTAAILKLAANVPATKVSDE